MNRHPSGIWAKGTGGNKYTNHNHVELRGEGDRWEGDILLCAADSCEDVSDYGSARTSRDIRYGGRSVGFTGTVVFLDETFNSKGQ